MGFHTNKKLRLDLSNIYVLISVLITTVAVMAIYHLRQCKIQEKNLMRYGNLQAK